MKNSNLEKAIILVSGLEDAGCGFGDESNQIRKLRGYLSGHLYEKSVIWQVSFQ